MTGVGEVTAIVSSVRATLAMLREIAVLVGAPRRRSSHRADRAAAANLNTLAFRELVKPLTNIANNKGTDSDVKEIQRFLRESQEATRKSVKQLTDYAPTVRESFGIERAWRFNDLVLSKSILFMELHRMVQAHASEEENKAIFFSGPTKELWEILDRIDRLNKTLIEFHDTILPPSRRVTKARKTQVRKQQ